MKINAIIFGVTGMVGEGVLHQALENSDIESVLVINRRSCGIKHIKLKEIIHNDFFDWASLEKQLTGYNSCFFCLGLSSVGMNEKDYTQITYDLTIKAAETLVRLNTEMTFCYVSGAGTDSSEKGKSMWGRIKGKTENHLMQLPFKDSYMFRPGFIRPIKGLRNTYRIYKIIDPAFPLFKFLFPKYVCTLEDLGNAMIQVVKAGYSRKIIECNDMAILSQSMEKLPY